MIEDYKKRINYDMWADIVKFPRTADMINRDMDKKVDQSKDILERSEALLRWAEDMKNESDDTVG